MEILIQPLDSKWLQLKDWETYLSNELPDFLNVQTASLSLIGTEEGTRHNTLKVAASTCTNMHEKQLAFWSMSHFLTFNLCFPPVLAICRLVNIKHKTLRMKRSHCLYSSKLSCTSQEQYSDDRSRNSHYKFPEWCIIYLLSTWLLVWSWLLCIQHLPCSGKFAMQTWR